MIPQTRGERADVRGTPPRRFPENRLCTAPGCSTTLSIYNGHEHCWLHLKTAPVVNNVHSRT